MSVRSEIVTLRAAVAGMLYRLRFIKRTTAFRWEMDAAVLPKRTMARVVWSK